MSGCRYECAFGEATRYEDGCQYDCGVCWKNCRLITDFETLPVWQVFVAVYTEKLSMAGSAGMKNMREVHISVRII